MQNELVNRLGFINVRGSSLSLQLNDQAPRPLLRCLHLARD